jgi:hypothetical protein
VTNSAVEFYRPSSERLPAAVAEAAPTTVSVD